MKMEMQNSEYSIQNWITRKNSRNFTTIFTILIAILSISNPISAQFNAPTYSDSALSQPVLELDGLLDYQATSLRRELTDILLFGGYIDQDIKDRSFDKHQEINRFGININNEIRYIHGKGSIFKRDSLTWLLKAGYFAVGGATYGKDVFGLLFYGNDQYLGQTTLLTNTRVEFTQFQKVGFGILNKNTKSSITLNMVNVQNYFDAYIRKGELTQTDDGSQIDLLLNGELKTTDSKNFNKGLGLGIDIDFRVRVPWGKSTSTIQLSAQNLGFAYLYDGVKTYEVDSSYSYSGFQFNSFTDSSNAFSDDFSLLDSLGVQQTTKKRTIVLPGYIQAMKLVDLNSSKKIQSFFGIRFYPTFNSIPSIFAGAYWKIVPKFHLSSSISYGGFGLFRAGIYMTLKLNKINITMGSDDGFGLVSKQGFGTSLLTRISYKL